MIHTTTHKYPLLYISSGETMNNVRESKDAMGKTVEKLQEQYQGIDVYDATVTVKKDKHGKMTGDASGTLIQDIEKDIPDVTPKLTDKESLEIVANAEGDDVSELSDVRIERKIFIDKTSTARVVNKISYLEDGVKQPTYIVDMNDGTILKSWQGLTTLPCCDKTRYGIGGNEKAGMFHYGDMPYCMTPTRVGDICFLENEYVRVVDMQYSYNETIVETANYNCTHGYGDTVNGAYSPALDAFFYGTVVGKMFEEWFNTTALNDKIVIRVHYGEMYGNAFWNGVNCTFGDGDYYDMFPFTTLDVMGHEIAHGVSEQGSGLEYYDEQGGVNEAFSDIMGEAAEEYLLRSDMVTGYSVMKNMPWMRDFERPEKDNMSIGHVSQMNTYTDPHYSSGIYRRVWYVLIHNHKMNVRDAASVFLFANRMYWHASASFYDVSCGLLMAALDLGFSTYAFHDAFSDVGIEHCDLSTHAFALNNNETQEHVKVGENVNPIFKFETPEWAANLVIVSESAESVTSRHDRCVNCSYPSNYTEDAQSGIYMTVMAGGWEISDDPCDKDKGHIVAEGYSPLIVEHVADQEFYIKLSLMHWTNSSDYITYYDYEYVDFTVGYTCQDDFYAYNYMDRYYYNEVCGMTSDEYG